MTVKIAFSEEPAWVLTTARRFLAADPVLHSLILTLLHERIAQDVPGRYWLAIDGEEVFGVVFQSPHNFPATLSFMNPEIIELMVEAISKKGVLLPGALGEASVVARFTGLWTEVNASAAVPYQGLRLYEITKVENRNARTGRLRMATTEDRELVLHWMRGFQTDINEPRADIEDVFERRLRAGQIWLWDDKEPVSMAVHSVAVEGVKRIQVVYTAPEFRNRGYSSLCVGSLSKQILESGSRCILYTDLGNPVSNSVFRKIGYRALFECLRYRFD